MKKKILIASIVTLTLALLVAVGGTVAWLVANTNEVTNVFTPTNIDVFLEESTSNYKMIPGSSIPKDPKVSVDNDIKCHVFVKIDESTNFDDYLSYAIADGWQLYNTSTNTVEAFVSGVEYDNYVIYRVVEAGSTKAISWSVLSNDNVYVKDTVDKTMMNALELDSSIYPKITFKAAAVQFENLESPSEAYKNINWAAAASAVVTP